MGANSVAQNSSLTESSLCSGDTDPDPRDDITGLTSHDEIIHLCQIFVFTAHVKARGEYGL